MADQELAPNSFTTYVLNTRDTLEGSVYNTNQLKVLHNLRAAYAEEKIALDYDPEHPLLFAQAEASLKGSLDLITYLIDSSKASLIALTDNQTNYEV